MSDYFDGRGGNPFAPGAGQVGYERHLAEQRAQMDAIKIPTPARKTKATGNAVGTPSKSSFGTTGYLSDHSTYTKDIYQQTKDIASAIMNPANPIWLLGFLASIYFFGFSDFGAAQPAETFWEPFFVGAFITGGLYGGIMVTVHVLVLLSLAVCITLRWLLEEVVIPLAIFGAAIAAIAWVFTTLSA